MIENTSLVAWGETDEVRGISKGQEEPFGVMGVFDTIIVVMVSSVIYACQNLLNCIL